MTHQTRNLAKPMNNPSTNLHPRPIAMRPINHCERDPSTTHDPRWPPKSKLTHLYHEFATHLIRIHAVTHLATHDLATTHIVTWPTLEPMPKNTHHCELKRDVMRERSVDWIVVERGRAKVWEETQKRERAKIWNYATVRSYIWDGIVANL